MNRFSVSMLEKKTYAYRRTYVDRRLENSKFFLSTVLVLLQNNTDMQFKMSGGGVAVSASTARWRLWMYYYVLRRAATPHV